MDQEHPFVVLRYFLVEEDQRSISPKPLPVVKGLAILDALLPERDWDKNGVRYSFVGFTSVNPSRNEIFPKNRFFVGKIAKLRKAYVGEKVPGDIIEHEEDDWIPLMAIFDSVSQTVFVQKDWRFGTLSQICTAIEAGLREPTLAIYNHRVFVEPKPTEGKFWEIIASHNKLYNLELRLISPNILQTNVKAREALVALKDLFGQDEIVLKMKNDSGSLEMPKEPMSDYIEYIEEGEGAWKMTTEGVHGGKKSHSSADTAETIELEVSIHNGDGEKQLDLETGEPSSERGKRDKRMVEKAFRYIEGKFVP